MPLHCELCTEEATPPLLCTEEATLPSCTTTSPRVTTACCSSAALRTGNRRTIYCRWVTATSSLHTSLSSCSLVLSLCCFAMASFSQWREAVVAVHPVLGLLPLAITVTMFVAHAFGINSVLHLVTSEVFPTRVSSCHTVPFPTLPYPTTPHHTTPR